MYNPFFASLYNAISFSNHGTFDTAAISMLRDLVGIKEVCTSRPREVHVAHLIGGIVPSLPRPRHFLHLSSVPPSSPSLSRHSTSSRCHHLCAAASGFARSNGGSPGQESRRSRRRRPRPCEVRSDKEGHIAQLS